MPKFPKSTGFKMKGYNYPGESPLKIASVSGAQLVQSVGKTYDKYVNYGKLVGDELKKGIDRGKPHKRMSGSEEENGKEEQKETKVESTTTSSSSDSSEMLGPNYSLGDLSGGTGGLGTKKSGGFGSATL